MLPGILNQLGAESLSSLKKLAHTVAGGEYFRKYTERESQSSMSSLWYFVSISLLLSMIYSTWV